MRLSVVMPVLNEAAGIVDALLPLQAVRDRVEVIVVDGGSSDDTCTLARPMADQLLVSAPGRARQMNTGAAAASGDVLLFLHADTRLPFGFEKTIEGAVRSAHTSSATGKGTAAPELTPRMDPRVREDDGAVGSEGLRAGVLPSGVSLTGTALGDDPASAVTHNPVIPANAGIHSDLPPGTQWGRFDVRLAPSSPLLKLVGGMMNQRSRLTGICTGDQAIFVRRELFEQLRGYADIALMEDIELSRRLRKISRPACLRPPLTTSSRKWQKHGVWRTIGTMWWIRLQYWAGVSPERLVRQYYRPAAGPSKLAPTPADVPPARPLLIFAKAPIPGTVKTRLIPALGAEGACTLYQQLLMRTLQQTRDWPGPRYLYCAPDTTHPLFTRLATEHDLQLRQQHGADLGARMAQALAEHAQGGLLIGTDCPLISTALLRDADQALATYDTVILPSEDGGYVMIGQRQPDSAAFTDMRWSHAQVMADTRQRLLAAGLSLWEGPTLWDLDEPADLPRLQSVALARI